MMTSLPEKPVAKGGKTLPTLHISVSAGFLLGIAVLVAGVAFAFGWLLPIRSPLETPNLAPNHPANVAVAPGRTSPAAEAPTVPPAAKEVEVQTKPWGTLELTRLTLTPPLEFIQQMSLDPQPRKWYFHNSKNDLVEFLKTAHLSDAQSIELWGTNKEEFGDNQVFRPSDAFAKNLTPEQRRIIYTRLGEDDRNTDQVNIFRSLNQSVEQWLAPAKLPPE
ncbi:MAG TPA: hypothetical protein VFE24_05835, partial [Pirellulales bacterium]|nr:hypothetical protein [Pirellulales bacterium]